MSYSEHFILKCSIISPNRSWSKSATTLPPSAPWYGPYISNGCIKKSDIRNLRYTDNHSLGKILNFHRHLKKMWRRLPTFSRSDRIGYDNVMGKFYPTSGISTASWTLLRFASLFRPPLQILPHFLFKNLSTLIIILLMRVDDIFWGLNVSVRFIKDEEVHIPSFWWPYFRLRTRSTSALFMSPAKPKESNIKLPTFRTDHQRRYIKSRSFLAVWRNCWPRSFAITADHFQP